MALGCEVLPGGTSDPGFVQPARVDVVEAVGASTTFVLSYDIAIADGDIALASEDRLGPEAELAVRVATGSSTAILVRGPVTRQRLSVVTGGDGSTLDVIGGDVTTAMAREVTVKVWPSTTDDAAIRELLAQAGIAPDKIVLPTSVVHDETKNALVQRESDLHLLRRLARRNGCWLWITYDPKTALASANVVRPPVDLEPAVVFNLVGKDRNIDDAVIEWDAERVVATDAAGRDVFGAQDIDGSVDRSPLAPMGTKALADIVASPRRARLTHPVDDAGDLIVRSEAALIEEGWFVTATVAVRERRLKQVVRAHTVAELHGVGKRHSGKYLVVRVAHSIDANDHLMTVTLVRNGWN